MVKRTEIRAPEWLLCYRGKHYTLVEAPPVNLSEGVSLMQEAECQRPKSRRNMFVCERWKVYRSETVPDETKRSYGELSTGCRDTSELERLEDIGASCASAA